MINRLMILCSRLNLNSQVLSEIESILGLDLDWRKLIKKASDEGVSPLLFHNLKKFQSQIPESAVGQLKEIYILNTARNVHTYRKLKPLLQAINDSRLKVAVTKGARLAETLYPDIGLRFFADVDLIVHPPDWPRLKEIIEKLGFCGDEYDKKFSTQKREKLYWNFSPVFKKDRLNIEMHFNYPGLGIPISMNHDLWDCSQSVELFDTEARVFSPEYELCILCTHVQQHDYSRLIWLTDIAELASREELDWDKIIYICREEEICASVYYGLYLVSGLWPRTISKNILDKFRPGIFKKKLLRFLWPEEKILSRKSSIRFPMHTPILFPLLSKKRIFFKLKTLFHIFFPPRAWVSYYHKIPAHSVKIFYHYLWRLYRPIWLFSRLLFRRR